MSDAWMIAQVHNLQPTDQEQLAQLLIDVVADGASVGFLPPVEWADAQAYWQEVLTEGVLLWVARWQGEIVGSVQLHLCLKPNGSHRAEIAKLMVHPSARRKGIGQQLMQLAETRAVAEGRSLLVLDTRAGDPSNVLYRGLGYIEAGRIPQFARSADGHLHDTVLYYKTFTALDAQKELEE